MVDLPMIIKLEATEMLQALAQHVANKLNLGRTVSVGILIKTENGKIFAEATVDEMK